MKVELYTRQGCHLCDDAYDLLKANGLEPMPIDIDTRPDLLSRYTNCVPVVVINDKVRFRGRIDPRLLTRLLETA